MSDQETEATTVENRARALFVEHSDLSEAKMDRQLERWERFPKTVRKARVSWPLWVGCVLVVNDYCGLQDPVRAGEIINDVLDERPTEVAVDDLLHGTVPARWRTDAFQAKVQRALDPEESVVDKVASQFMDIVGMNEAALKACLGRQHFGAGNRDNIWVACVLAHTEGYEPLFESDGPNQLASAVYAWRQHDWKFASQEEKDDVFVRARLPERWVEAVPLDRFQAGPEQQPLFGDDKKDEPPNAFGESEAKVLKPGLKLVPRKRETTAEDVGYDPEAREEPEEEPEVKEESEIPEGVDENEDEGEDSGEVIDAEWDDYPEDEGEDADEDDQTFEAPTGIVYLRDPIPLVPRLSENQLAIRRTGITATDISAIAGLNPWRTAFDVFLDKVNPEPRQVNKNMIMGSLLEDDVLRLYLEEVDHDEYHRYGTMKSPDHPEIIATPDATVDDRLVEAKTTGYEWEDVPIYYVAQVHWQWGVLSDLGVDLDDYAHLATLTGHHGFDLLIWEIEINREYLESLREMGRRFWRDHVLTESPPPLTSGDADTMNLVYPRHNERGAIITANEEAERIFGLLTDFAIEHRLAEMGIDKCTAKLKDIIGEAPGIVFDSGHRITWKNNAQQTSRSWKNAFSALVRKLLAAGLDAEAISRAATEAEEENTTIKVPGPRVFRPNLKKLLPEDIRS